MAHPKTKPQRDRGLGALAGLPEHLGHLLEQRDDAEAEALTERLIADCGWVRAEEVDPAP